MTDDTAPKVPAGWRNASDAHRGVVRDFGLSLGTGPGRRAQDMQELEFYGMTRNDTPLPPLDRWRLDEVLEPDRHLWGLPEIARVAGVSIDTVRRWHRDTNAPITRPGGRYYSTRAAMTSWLSAR